jgi:hypothetical protein
VRRLVVILAVALALGAVTASGPAAATPRAKPYAGTVRLTIADLQDYWATTMPAVYGIAYTPIPPAKIIPYTSTSKVPRCPPQVLNITKIMGTWRRGNPAKGGGSLQGWNRSLPFGKGQEGVERRRARACVVLRADIQ